MRFKTRFVMLFLLLAFTVSSCATVIVDSSLSNTSSSTSSSSTSIEINSSSSSSSSSISSSADEEVDLEPIVHNINVSIDNIDQLFLKDIVPNDIIATGFDVSLYTLKVELSKDETTNSLTVNYYLKEIASGRISSTLSKVFKGFKVYTYDVATNLFIDVNDVPLVVIEGSLVTLKLSLLTKPEEDIKVSLSLKKSYGELSTSSVVFTPVDYKEAHQVSFLSYKDEASKVDKQESIYISYLNTNIKEIAVTIKNTDQVVKPVLIVPSAIEVDKGIQQSFDVYLSSEPEVTTNITLSSDSEHVNFVANTLIFNNENYNVPQSVNFMIDENSDVSQETIDQNKISGKALYSFTVTSSASSQSGYEITVNTGEKLAEGTHKVIDEDGKVTTCETTNGITSFTSGRLGKFVVYDENETSAVPGYMIAIASIEGVIILSLGVLILLKVYLPKKKPTAK